MSNTARIGVPIVTTPEFDAFYRRRVAMIVALTALAVVGVAVMVVVQRDPGERQSPPPAAGVRSAPTTRSQHFPPGAFSRNRSSTLAVEIAPGETFMIYGHALALGQLLAMAETVQVVDEATWRGHYSVTDFNVGSDIGPPVDIVVTEPGPTSVSASHLITVQPAG